MSRFLKLILLFCLALSFCVVDSACAADAGVSFEGGAENFVFRPGSTSWGDTDLFPDLKNAMPGDVLTDEILVEHNASDRGAVKIYLRAEPHNASNTPVIVNGETVASMNDFLTQLTLRVYLDGAVIYSASPDQASSLTNDFLLGEFNRGDSAMLTVELEVPSNLSNVYAHRAGEVDWVFTAVDDSIAAADTGGLSLPVTGSVVGDLGVALVLVGVVAGVVCLVHRRHIS